MAWVAVGALVRPRLTVRWYEVDVQVRVVAAIHHDLAGPRAILALGARFDLGVVENSASNSFFVFI